MHLYSISDLHIKSPEDQNYKILINLLGDIYKKKPKVLVLLGDIFDLMVGPKEEYVENYRKYFSRIEDFLNQGCIVYNFEGNHDFHIFELFKNKYSNFYYCNKPELIEFSGRKVLLCHGDEIEIDNISYKIYSKIIRSNVIKKICEVVPYKLIEYIGKRASKNSRKKNISKYASKDNLIRDKFRKSATIAHEKLKFDILIFGHSHIKDFYTNKELNFSLVNNGYFPVEKNYVSISSDGVIRLEPVPSAP